MMRAYFKVYLVTTRNAVCRWHLAEMYTRFCNFTMGASQGGTVALSCGNKRYKS